MAQSFTSDDLQALASYPFKDANWKNKFLIGGLVSFLGYIIPLVPWFVFYGYGAQIMRRVIVEETEPFLPEWDDWGKLFTDGIKPVGVGFVYTLPIWLVFGVGYSFFFAAIFIGATAGAGSDSPPAWLVFLPMFAGLGFTATIGVGALLGLALGVFMPVVIAHVIATDDFAAAFRFNECWSLFRANVSGFTSSYFLLVALGIGLGFVMQILYFTIIGCCLLPFILPFFSYYMMLIWSVIFGRSYRVAVQQLKLSPA
jgi:hypothetical protein